MISAFTAEERIVVDDSVFSLLLGRAKVRAELGRFADAEADLATAAARTGVFRSLTWGPFLKRSDQGSVGGSELEFARGRVDEYRSGRRRSTGPNEPKLRRAVSELNDPQQRQGDHWRWSRSGKGPGAADDEITRSLWRFLESPHQLGPLFLSSPCDHEIVLSAGLEYAQRRVQPWEDRFRELSAEESAKEDASFEQRLAGGLGAEKLDLMTWEEAHQPVGEPCWRDRPLQLMVSGWSPSRWLHLPVSLTNHISLERSFVRPIEVEALDLTVTDAFAALGLPRAMVRPTWRWEREDWESCRPRRVVGTSETGSGISIGLDAGSVIADRTQVATTALPASLSTGVALSREITVPRPMDLDVTRRDGVADILRQVLADPMRYKFVVFVSSRNNRAAVQFATSEWSDVEAESVLAEVVGMQNLPEMDRGALWVRGWGDQISRGEKWLNWGWEFRSPIDPCHLANEAEWVFTEIWRIGDGQLTANTYEGRWGASTSAEEPPLQ